MDPRLVMVMTPLLGLVVGSFVGLVSLRLPVGGDVVLARSRCGGCGRALGPLDLVPVLSWLGLRGRCRTCAAPIPARYPLIELACAGLGLWAALHHQGDVQALVTALFGWGLLLIALVDAEHFWLPDVLTLPLLAGGLLAAGLLAPDDLIARGAGALAGFAGLWVIGFLYRRARGRDGLGGGDPILFAAIGAWVGWIGLPSVLVWACAAAFSLVAARLMLRRPVRAEDRLPFGPFLAVGAWMVWLYGPISLSAY